MTQMAEQRHDDELSGIHVPLCQHEQLVRRKDLELPTPDGGTVSATVRERIWKELRGSAPSGGERAAMLAVPASMAAMAARLIDEEVRAQVAVIARRLPGLVAEQLDDTFLEGMRAALAALPAPTGAGAAESVRLYRRALQALEPRQTSDGAFELVLGPAAAAGAVLRVPPALPAQTHVADEPKADAGAEWIEALHADSSAEGDTP